MTDNDSHTQIARLVGELRRELERVERERNDALLEVKHLKEKLHDRRSWWSRWLTPPGW